MNRTHAFFAFLVRHRAAVVAAYGLLLAAAVPGLLRLRVDYSAEQFFLFEGEEREVYDLYKAQFPREDLRVSAFLEVGNGLTPEDFELLDSVAQAFDDAGLESVRWIGGVELVEEVVEEGQPAVSFIRLAEDRRPSEARLDSLLDTRRDHPLWTGVLWNRDQSVFAVHGFLAPDDNTDAHRREVTAGLRQRLSGLRSGDRRLVLNGLPVLRVTVPLALSTDLVTLLGIGVLAALALVRLYFRRTMPAVLTLAGVVPAVLIVMGAMGYLGRPVSVLTSSTPIVVLVVGMCDAIHLLVGARGRALRGDASRAAVASTFAGLARACLFTSLTTALGFLGLAATRIPLVAEFGVTTAVAVLATWAVTQTLLPALLSFVRDFGPTDTRLSQVCDGVARGAAGTLRLRSGLVLAGFGAVMAAGLALGLGLEVRAYLIDDLRDGDPILEELRWLESSGFGVFQVDVFVNHGDVPGHHPRSLEWAERTARAVEDDTLVIGTVTLPAVVREMGRAAGLDAGFAAGPFAAGPGRDPWSERTVRELLFVAELQGDDFLEDLYRVDDGVSRIVFTVRDAGSRPTSDFLDRLETRLSSDPPPGGTASVTGTVKLSEVLWDRLIGRFLPGVALSVLLVWLALSRMFRSFRYGFVALLPNLFPLAILAGVLRLGGFDLKPSTALVFSMVFGIVVDDTIHVLARLAELRDGSHTRDPLRTVFSEVGPALVLSTLVVCVGFGVLVLSRFEALLLIGLFTALAAILALLADLIALPHLFRVSGITPVQQPHPGDAPTPTRKLP